MFCTTAETKNDLLLIETFRRQNYGHQGSILGGLSYVIIPLNEWSPMTIKALKNYVVTVILSQLMLLLLVGCAMNSGPSASYLLEQDYQSMSNVELTAYEQELNDQINQDSTFGFGGTSIGFGLGSWGSNSGVGIGVNQSLGDGSDSAMELRAHRDAVRTEMRNRRLLPPPPDTSVPSGSDRSAS